MKLTIEVELDWVDDEEEIDKQVKHLVIEKISEKLVRRASEKGASLYIQAESRLKEKIDGKIDEIIEAFNNKKFIRFDNYGNERDGGKEITVIEVLKERYDNFLSQRVNTNGSVSVSNDFHSKPRLEHMIDYAIKNMLLDSKREYEEMLIKKINAVKIEMSQDIERDMISKLAKLLSAGGIKI